MGVRRPGREVSETFSGRRGDSGFVRRVGRLAGRFGGSVGVGDAPAVVRGGGDVANLVRVAAVRLDERRLVGVPQAEGSVLAAGEEVPTVAVESNSQHGTLVAAKLGVLLGRDTARRRGRGRRRSRRHPARQPVSRATSEWRQGQERVRGWIQYGMGQIQVTADFGREVDIEQRASIVVDRRRSSSRARAGADVVSYLYR